MRPPVLRIHADELLVDNFAGGGGTSTGIEWACGRSPDIAVNHDAEAIAMHKANHPRTKHFQENVWDVDPVAVCGGRPVALAWFSPDCTHHSKARGGKPFRDPKKAKRSRALAHVVIRWARAVKPRVIILENVEEFEEWGPLGNDGKPDPARAGLSFRIWRGQLRAAGYVVEMRQLRACDYGAPTTRRRLFIIARSDGLPIVWPKPTHGKGLEPYRTAAECIDWGLPVRSIFGRKKPLAENTLRRIARGLRRYVIENPEPFIIPVKTWGGGGNEPRSLHEPMRTVTASKRGEFALVTPYLEKFQQNGTGCPVDEPVHTVMAGAQRFGLVAPLLQQSGWGEREGQAPRTLDLFKPLGTLMAEGNKHALVAAFLAKHYGGKEGKNALGPLDPLDTITTVDHHALVAAHIQRDFSQSVGSAMQEPLPTVTGGGGGHAALVASHLLKLRGGLEDHANTAQDLRLPAPTLTAGGNHLAEVRAFLLSYYGSPVDAQLRLPLHTITTKDRFALVLVRGLPYILADIAMRMLVARELFRAQSFPDSYVIQVSLYGKPLTQEAQVRMCGNSVPPVMSEALVRAQFTAEAAVEVSA